MLDRNACLATICWTWSHTKYKQQVQLFQVFFQPGFVREYLSSHIFWSFVRNIFEHWKKVLCMVSNRLGLTEMKSEYQIKATNIATFTTRWRMWLACTYSSAIRSCTSHTQSFCIQKNWHYNGAKFSKRNLRLLNKTYYKVVEHLLREMVAVSLLNGL